MGKVIDLDTFRRETTGKAGFVCWQKRFGHRFTVDSTLADLPDSALLRLASPGEDSAGAFFELIIGVLNLGPPDGFSQLAGRDKMRVVDIQLLLADQVRFEMMRRIGWLERFAGQDTPLGASIQSFDELQARCREQAPVIGAAHPEADRYADLPDRDKHACIRRFLPHALAVFNQRFPPSP